MPGSFNGGRDAEGTELGPLQPHTHTLYLDAMVEMRAGDTFMIARHSQEAEMPQFFWPHHRK